MLFNTISLLALVASATAYYPPTCQTSSSSPNIGDARSLLDKISGKYCANGVGGNFNCKLAYQSGTASLNVCGGDPILPIECSHMHDALNQLILECNDLNSQGPKVGGSVKLNDKTRLDLFHS
ncbi:hypothetical protein CYLTODRAFT_444725 [Cylindrobasidium torrendii FP15055 ss-10]|uniref:Cyanovirin-N domain-containing protein n=1 Tax=Cylindrobasidium torrendii FP15055 ss-10 TaxID=1314674 RepID=A0A0D7B791_9AGAR|nr:hypothetical protein CYLTODRAFT_444725 [Cylindrobasidium torrendii FP15055 ss-10]